MPDLLDGSLHCQPLIPTSHPISPGESMMSRFNLLGTLALICLLVLTAASARADSANDECLKQGDPIGVFYVTKVAGAEDDGVEPGEDLCYRCRYGSRPMVMVFARDTGGNVPELLKKIEAAVVANEDASLRGLMTLIGEDAAKLKEEAGKLAKKSSVKKVPVVVAKETKTGPLNYRLPSDVAVTIVVARDSQVVNTYLYAADEIDIAAVMSEVQQMLN
jgi:hypothetical protein